MGNQGNSGRYSKFQQRLRNIRLFRSKNKKKVDQEKFIQEKVEEIRKVIYNDSSKGKASFRKKGIGQEEVFGKEKNISQVIVNIRGTAQDRSYGKKKSGIPIGGSQSIISEKKSLKDKKSFTDVTKKLVENKDFSFIKKKRGVSSSKTLENQKNLTELEKKKLLQEMGSEIIDRIKNSFEERIDELEVLESDLFLLNEKQKDELELKKVIEIKKKIQELIQKVNVIIEQYNLYNYNYYIDYMVGIDDSVLMDDILDYKYLLDSEQDQKKFVKEYKILEEFKSLYVHLKKVKADTEALVQKNEAKIHEFDVRDKKYHNIQLGFVNVRKIDQKCSLEIERQNQYFSDLMQKINVIDKEEYTTTHLKGINQLLGQSLRYLGLMILSPLSGLIPSISISAIATRRMINNIYQNMKLEEVHHVHYEAINYDSELSHHLCDVDYTACLLDDTLKDIERLKEDFMLQYDSRIPGYDDTLKKISMIENKVIHNQNKVDIIKKNLKRSKKINEEKMIKIKKLNENKVS